MGKEVKGGREGGGGKRGGESRKVGRMKIGLQVKRVEKKDEVLSWKKKEDKSNSFASLHKRRFF